MTTLEKIQDIFRDVFDDEKLVLTENTNSDDIEEWDSLAHIRLMAAVEQEFCVKFSFKELNEMKNVASLVECIESKLS